MNYNPQYGARITAGRWSVQYLSLIVALQDIGPGDGATVLVLGSHKSEIAHLVQQMMRPRRAPRSRAQSRCTCKPEIVSYSMIRASAELPLAFLLASAV